VNKTVKPKRWAVNKGMNASQCEQSKTKARPKRREEKRREIDKEERRRKEIITSFAFQF
jgi:hypothetical protein